MRAYLKERLGAVMLWFLCTALLALSFALFRLPLRAVWYPAACMSSGTKVTVESMTLLSMV